MTDPQTEARLGTLAFTLAFLLLALPFPGEALQVRRVPRPLPPPVWNNPPQQPIPGVEHNTFHSNSMNEEVGYNLLLPPGYSSGERRYPVVYWLHGGGGTESQTARILGPLIVEAMSAGAVPPMIVVFANGGFWSWFADSPDGSIRAETAFISELIPHIDATHRTVAERSGRAIEGMSMGGFAALVHAMKHVELFGSVVAYAPALHEVQEAPDGTLTLARAGGTHEGGSRPVHPVRLKEVFERMFGSREAFEDHSPWALVRTDAVRLRTELPVRIVIGTADGLWNANQLFHELLLEHGYDHEFEVVNGAGHNYGLLTEGVVVEGLLFHARSGGWR